jgi:hypothetical protein
MSSDAFTVHCGFDHWFSIVSAKWEKTKPFNHCGVLIACIVITSLAPANAQLSISFALNKFGDKSNKSSWVESRIE